MNNSHSSNIVRKFLVCLGKIPVNLDIISYMYVTQGYNTSREELIVQNQARNNLETKFFKSGELICEDEFNIRWPDTLCRRLEKEIFFIDDHSLELIYYTDKNLTGLIIAAVKFPDHNSAQQFIAPTWFEREITNESYYDERNLVLIVANSS